MVDLPNLAETSPDRWLSRLDELRDELVDELVSLLETSPDNEKLADGLEELVEDAESTAGGEESLQLFEVQLRDESVAVRHPSEENWVELKRTDRGWRTGDASGETTDRHELAESLLEHVPWWSEGAFASQVGNPGRFVKDDD